jgi:WD40 repeat protein
MFYQVLARARLHAIVVACGLFSVSASGQQPTKVDLYGDPLPPGAVARLGTLRYRHGGHSRGVFFLPDSSTVITSPDERSLRFWEARTGKLLREFQFAPLYFRTFTLSPDGKQIALAGSWILEDQSDIHSEIRVVSAETGRTIQTFKRASRDGCNTLAFTPDGKLLASLGEAGILRIEEVESGLELLTQSFPRDNSASLAISPHGKQIVVQTGPNTRKNFLWNWQSGEEPQPLTKGRDGEGGGKITFSPDGRFLAWAGYGREPLHIWDAEKATLLTRLSPPNREEYLTSAFQFSPDGKTLFTPLTTPRRVINGGKERAGFLVWNTDDWRVQKSIDFDAADFAISPDGRLLATRDRVFDLEANKPLSGGDEAHRGTITQIIARPDQIITASDDHSIRVWDPATGRQRLQLRHDYWVRAMALSPDGKHLVSSGLDDTVRLWELPGGKELYRLPGHGRLGGMRAVSFIGDGELFCSFGDDFYLRVYDVRRGKAVHEFRIRPDGLKIPAEDDDDGDSMLGSLISPQFSADGKSLTLCIGKNIDFYDVFSGELTKQWDYDGGMILSLAFSADGKRMLSGAWGKSMEVKLPDGGTLHTHARTQTFTIWNRETNAAEKTIVIPQEGVGPAAFSPDGTRVGLTTGAGRQVMIFRLDGKAESILPNVPGRISRIAFTPDGRSLITALGDTSVLVWGPDALAEPPPAE